MTRPHPVCGECCALLLEAGGREQVPSGLALGVSCERHSSLAATRVVLAEDGALPPVVAEGKAATLPAPSSESAPVTRGRPAASFGPVTELAARLLASWTHKSEGAKADEMMVSHAASVARRLIAETGGL